MLERSTLVNAALFLERVQMTGKEALAWVETYQAIVAEINAVDNTPRSALEGDIL